MTFYKNQKQKGFTLIEMLVIAPIVILAIGAFLTVVISMTGEVLSSRGANALTFDIQDTMNRIEQDVKQSYGFLAQNSITPISPQGYDNSTGVFYNTSAAGTNGQMLILNMPVTNGNPILSTTGIVYLKNAPNACGGSAEKKNAPMTMNVVYFVKANPDDPTKSSLWRRTIMPAAYSDSALRCSTPWQQPSCLPGISGTLCKTNDVKLVEGVTINDFSLQYFTNASSLSATAGASDPAVSPDTRTIALAGTPTVGVSITARQSVAGRTVERAATLRATRLETNASSIAAAVPNTAPSPPSVTAKYAIPESAQFNWGVSTGGNVSYIAEWNINGGAWTATASSSARTFTKAATRGQTVNVRVRAVNLVNGITTYSAYSAVSSFTIPKWNNLSFVNGWSNYSDGAGTGYTDGQFTKTSAGVVVVRGVIKKSSAVVVGQVIATLPAAYRPAYDMTFLSAVSGTDTASITVQANGDIVGNTDINATASSLDRLVFLAADAPVTWVTPAFTTVTWANRNSAGDPPLSYAVDSLGRVWVRGAIDGTPITDGTPIATLPAYSQKLIIGVRSGCNGINVINVEAGVLSPRGMCTGTILHTNFHYIPTSYTASSWVEATPSTAFATVHAWVNYAAGGNTTAAYTIAPDGLVTLKGLIKSGTATAGTSMVESLPVGSRPEKTMIIASVCNNSACRIETNSLGQIVGRGMSTTWTSINGISFLGDI